jgi:hypothetical protein
MADVSVGAIRLYDDVTTALAAGRYRFTSRVAVSDVDGAGQAPAPDHVLPVEVAAPRFTLDAADVVSVHPAPDSSGDVRDRLAHVALSRRTLPWERRFDDGTPWVALLVVADGEGQVTEPRPLRQAVGETLFARLAAADPIDGDGPAVATLRLRDTSVLTGLWPRRHDVRLLTHVRQVNIADSALAGTDDDGWFAIVTANRLPTQAVNYQACLVSLEGQDGLWAAPPTSVPPLVVLYHWKFAVTGAGTFESLAAALDAGLIGARALGPVDPSVTLTRVDRDGSAVTVRYRGPLLAAPPVDETPADDDVSIDDVSLVAAQELGRLMATADARFTREIVAWHRTANLAQTRQVFSAAVRDAVSGPAADLAVGGDADLTDIRARLRRRLAATAAPPADPFGVPPAARRLAAADMTADGADLAGATEGR